MCRFSIKNDTCGVVFIGIIDLTFFKSDYFTLNLILKENTSPLRVSIFLRNRYSVK